MRKAEKLVRHFGPFAPTRVVHARDSALIRRFGMQFAYGHREIYLKESELPSDSLLMGIVQHGVGPAFVQDCDWPTPRDFSLKRTPLWVYSKLNIKDLLDYGVKDVRAIGSPWCYALKQFNLNSTKPQKEYCLAFASHTRFDILEPSTTFELIKKIRIWKKLADGQKLVICLYWIDFLDKNWQEAARAEDVEIVCAGIDLTDPKWSLSPARTEFYKNLHSILSLAEFCIFEGFTSAIFYAASLDIPFGIFVSDFEAKRIVARSSDFSPPSMWLKKHARKNLNNFHTGSEFKNLAMDLLGFENLLSKDQLQSSLEWVRLNLIAEKTR